MYTLELEDNRFQMVKTAQRYQLAALLALIFGAVYEHFSFGVYSYYMLYAFVFPLVGGAVPALAIALTNLPIPGWTTRSVYAAAIATFTIGSIMQGVLDIYGTTNRLIRWYWVAGVILIIISIFTAISARVELRIDKSLE